MRPPPLRPAARSPPGAGSEPAPGSWSKPGTGRAARVAAAADSWSGATGGTRGAATVGRCHAAGCARVRRRLRWSAVVCRARRMARASATWRRPMARVSSSSTQAAAGLALSAAGSRMSGSGKSGSCVLMFPFCPGGVTVSPAQADRLRSQPVRPRREPPAGASPEISDGMANNMKLIEPIHTKVTGASLLDTGKAEGTLMGTGH